MSRTIGQFGFELVRRDKLTPGEISLPPYVYLNLKGWTEHNGTPGISAQLMSEGEIDAIVDALKKDLDKVGRSAKKGLAQALRKRRKT